MHLYSELSLHYVCRTGCSCRLQRPFHIHSIDTQRRAASCSLRLHTAATPLAILLNARPGLCGIPGSSHCRGAVTVTHRQTVLLCSAGLSAVPSPWSEPRPAHLLLPHPPLWAVLNPALQRDFEMPCHSACSAAGVLGDACAAGSFTAFILTHKCFPGRKYAAPLLYWTQLIATRTTSDSYHLATVCWL